MIDSISAMPAEIATWLSNQTDTFTDVTFLTEFPAIPKAIPLRQTIVAVGLDNVRISDFFTENSEGEQVPDEYCRLAKVRIRVSIHVPYSAGGTACHTAFTKIVDCLNFKSDFNISESGCESIAADRDTDAFVMKSWIDIQAQFCPAESAAVQYAAFMPKTMFCRSHLENTDIHVTTQDKAHWNSPLEIGYYSGTGNGSRTVSLGYRPKFVLVFPAVYPPFYNLSSDPSQLICLCGMAGQTLSSSGIELTSTGFRVTQSSEIGTGNTLTKLNWENADYIYCAMHG
ncbi:MAG TPA: hypothetical protein DDY98_01145 [Ruminococcaceae bacterium]|nr:hypothetical protein [Oscillospiraceae bacterium]